MSRTFIHNMLFIFIATIFWSCSASPKFTSDDPQPSRPKVDKPARDIDTSENESTKYDEFHNVSVLETKTGIASYYGEEFNGNLTSNGEKYDMYGLSAAHPTYPEGTIVRVTNLSNNKSGLIRINDRMPQYPDRIIDLSYGTAKKLDMVEDGLAEVRIEVLKWGDGKYKH